MQALSPARDERKKMKTCPNFSRIGGFAAVLASLMLNADNCAQDVGVPKTPAGCAAAARLPNLATFSPDGASCAVAMPDGRVKFGSTKEGARRRTEHLCEPRAIVFSSDGRFLAVSGGGGCSGTGTIKVWRVADGARLCRVKTDGGMDPEISFSPNGLLLVTTENGSKINLWQVSDGTLLCSQTVPHAVSRLAFSNDGREVLAVLADGSLQRFAVR
jgi:WD40 repeat protein